MAFRQEKIKNSLIELGAQFIEKEMPSSTLITVTDCHVSPKGNHATILISVLPENKEFEILKSLEDKVGDLKKYIGENLRIRRIPDLKIQIDFGEKNRQRIEELSKLS